jgi:hypothetical protein
MEKEKPVSEEGRGRTRRKCGKGAGKYEKTMKWRGEREG